MLKASGWTLPEDGPLAGEHYGFGRRHLFRAGAMGCAARSRKIGGFMEYLGKTGRVKINKNTHTIYIYIYTYTHSIYHYTHIYIYYICNIYIYIYTNIEFLQVKHFWVDHGRSNPKECSLPFYEWTSQDSSQVPDAKGKLGEICLGYDELTP